MLRLPRGRHGEPAPALQGTGHLDAMAAPLYEAGRVVGVLAVTDRVDDVSTFDADDAKLLQALAGHASVALANNALVERVRRAAEQTEHLSLHDPLTGLPNRLHFHQRLERRLEATGSAAVLLMDLDRFKEVNDTLGHDVGDQLLRQVGQRLLALEHDETVVARMGGDEFAVMLTGDEVHVEGMVQRITRDFSRPIRLDDIELDVSASIGIAVAPQDGASAALLMRRAEVAMYDAKRGLAGVEHYASDRDPYSARRLSLISDLARALEEGRLELHYQPQAEPGSGRVTGVEALLRWQHPVWGNVPPDEFIPLAEHTGLIRPLTRFVLETAVQQCAAWQAAGTPVVMAVNVSMRNLLEPEFADVVARLLVQANLPAGLLKIEVTESAIIADPERALHALDKLVALGLSISVDDFGTGYSSLTRLRRLPVHEVKIDRAFVRDLADNTADLGHRPRRHQPRPRPRAARGRGGRRGRRRLGCAGRAGLRPPPGLPAGPPDAGRGHDPMAGRALRHLRDPAPLRGDHSPRGAAGNGSLARLVSTCAPAETRAGPGEPHRGRHRGQCRPGPELDAARG